MSKNIVTHVVSAAVVVAVGFSAGNAYHHQQAQVRAKAHAAIVAAEKAKEQAAAKAKAAELAAQQAAAAAKVKSVAPKSRVTSTTVSR